MTETIWPTMSKIFATWLIIEKVCQTWLLATIVSHLGGSVFFYAVDLPPYSLSLLHPEVRRMFLRHKSYVALLIQKL